MNETFQVERGLPGQNLGDLEESYAAGETLDLQHAQSSLLSATDDGLGEELPESGAKRLAGSPPPAKAIG